MSRFGKEFTRLCESMEEKGLSKRDAESAAGAILSPDSFSGTIWENARARMLRVGCDLEEAERWADYVIGGDPTQRRHSHAEYEADVGASFQSYFEGKGYSPEESERMAMIAAEGQRPGGLGWEGMGDEGYGRDPTSDPDPEPTPSEVEEAFFKRFELQYGPVVARRMAKIAAGTE